MLAKEASEKFNYAICEVCGRNIVVLRGFAGEGYVYSWTGNLISVGNRIKCEYCSRDCFADSFADNCENKVY